MMHLKWSQNQLSTRLYGPKSVIFHFVLLLFMYCIVHVEISYLISYELILFLWFNTLLIRKLPEEAVPAIWKQYAKMILAGAPWISALWTSQLLESLRYRQVMNRMIPLSSAKVPDSFYRSYHSSLAIKFLYSSLMNWIEIEFQGRVIRVRNYGNIVYENELYAVFIPENDNTLYIARIDKEQELLHLPSKDTYDVLFDSLQQK